MKKIFVVLLLAVLFMILTACGNSNDGSEVERLQLELELARTQLELETLRGEHEGIGQSEMGQAIADMAHGDNSYEEIVTPTTETATPTESMTTSVDVDYARQEMAVRFAPVNPSPVGAPPIGRWYRTHRENQAYTNSYTMHEFRNDGTVRTYQGCWERGERELLHERIWSIYNISEGHGRFITQTSIIRITDFNDTVLRFRLNPSRPATSQLDSLTQVNDVYEVVNSNPFVFDLPTPGRVYERLANIPEFSISGNWYYSDTVWPPPQDSQRFFVHYRLNSNGVLQAHYHVRERPDSTGTDSEWSRIGRWSVSDGVVHLHFDTGAIVSYSIHGEELRASNAVLQRELNVCLEHQRAVATEEVMHNAAIRNVMNRVIGRWHWDLALWYFNEDGTGHVYAPRIGVNPESYRHFTFEVMPPSAGYDAVIIIHSDDWEAGAGTSGIFLWVTFGTRSGGSMELHGGGENPEPFLLTRMFDTRNTPFVDQLFDDLGTFMDLLGNFIG